MTEEQFWKYFLSILEKEKLIITYENAINIPRKVFEIHSVLREVYRRSKKGLYSRSAMDALKKDINDVINNKKVVIWEKGEFSFKNKKE